jgi:hypothetical protein
MALSVCATTFNNTGTVACSPVMDYADKLIFVPTFAADGTRNKLSHTAVFTQANLQALIDQADATKRWYPTPQLENIGGERAASTFETGSTGRRYKAKQGVRAFSFDIMNQWGLYQSVFESFACADMSFFIVDALGNLIGVEASTDDGYLYPMRISKDSMDSILGMPMPDKAVRISVSFEFDTREKDSLLRMMENVSTVMTANVADAEGLNTVYSTISSISTTGFTAALYTKHNGVTKVPITGLVITDFFDVRGGTASKLYNVTDSAAIALTSVTESPTVPGTYVFVITVAQTSADVLRLTPVKTQLDFTAVVASTILVP